MKKIKVFFIALALIMIPAGLAQAALFIDFDAAPIVFPSDPSSVTHNISGPDGNVSFLGQITNVLNGATQADHTTGSGQFLKTTSAAPVGGFSFDYDVGLFHGFAFVESGFTGVVGLFSDEAATNLIAVHHLTGSSQWVHIALDIGVPFRALVFGTVDGSFNMIGDKGAFDDIWVCPYSSCHIIPEPATMALMGIGLVGIGFFRRRKQ